MSDLIRIADLAVWTRLGVPDEERAAPQKILVTLEMDPGDLRPAAKKDDLSLTVDYAAVAELAEKFAANHSHRLLETFAERLAETLLAAFPLRHLTLEAKKFVLPEALYVSVRLERPAPGPGQKR